MKKVINTILLWVSALSSLLPITAFASGVVYYKALCKQVIKQTQQAVQLYKNLLSLPNDTQSRRHKKLSSWLIQAFNQRGVESPPLEMSGSTLIYAKRINPNAKKTVLVYIQADGQPHGSSHDSP
ncbi:hypothetical protein [Pseudoalteromonas umbrosa]|uniref:hypothetical protein n=1 Tax=Pseudoalteromonas umbrosa TaxID=3048489 RepID=UPI0024C3615B|nr:hypothetical protein [Pseudoalteromonas sp. B95]MDK1286245.1 hypothetical protein [Pseudoalteromonas sp. B95]